MYKRQGWQTGAAAEALKDIGVALVREVCERDPYLKELDETFAGDVVAGDRIKAAVLLGRIHEYCRCNRETLQNLEDEIAEKEYPITS